MQKLLLPGGQEVMQKLLLPGARKAMQKTAFTWRPGGHAKTAFTCEPGGHAKTAFTCEPGGHAKTAFTWRPGGHAKTAFTWGPGGHAKTAFTWGQEVMLKLLLPGAFAEENCLDGAQNNQHIQHQGHVLDIKKIIVEFFHGIFYGCTVIITHLGPSGYPGLYHKTL